ncbi:MAG: hypothetical protein JKZ00_05490 [Flavobacteriaceae bacterium]|nr:hypothetical protein [Flavobacteriaceae bacterium]
MKNQTKFLTLIVMTLLFASSFTSCNNKAKETVVESTFNLATAKTEIEAANMQFMTFYAANDSISLANLYTLDAKFMGDGAPSVTGRKNIQSNLSATMKSGVTSINLKTIDVWGGENLITEEGEASLFVGETEVYNGKYIVLWKKVDGEWKLFRDIFNSNSPAE